MTEEQDINFIFTLGQIKNKVETIGEQMRVSFERLEKKIDNDVKEIEDRLTRVEDYHSKLKTQVALIVSAVSTAVVLFGPTIRDWIF